MPDKPKTTRPGPNPDYLKLDEENWEEAVRKAVKKPKPAGGWPKPDDEGEKSPKPKSDG